MPRTKISTMGCVLPEGSILRVYHRGTFYNTDTPAVVCRAVRNPAIGSSMLPMELVVITGSFDPIISRMKESPVGAWQHIIVNSMDDDVDRVFPPISLRCDVVFPAMPKDQQLTLIATLTGRGRWIAQRHVYAEDSSIGPWRILRVWGE